MAKRIRKYYRYKEDRTEKDKAALALVKLVKRHSLRNFFSGRRKQCGYNPPEHTMKEFNRLVSVIRQD